MRLTKSAILITIVLELARPAMPADEKKVDWGEVERVALEELKATNTPGAAIAVTRGDQIVFAKGFGVSNVETGSPVTPDMLFRLGSTTKMFTAAALVTLAEQGKLRLDEPIGRYVKGLNPKIARVTAHQLLSHTAGIWDQAPMYGLHDDSALGAGVRAWKDDFAFLEPGVIISYSNPGYWLAGLLVEKLGGKPYADQVAESVFKPLGMARSTFRPTMAMTHKLSQGHNEPTGGKGAATVIRPIADNAGSWPAGSMYSSAVELARFAVAFLNEGKIEGKQALSPVVVARLSAPQADIPGEEHKYGYGLTIGRVRGIQLLEHGGARLGTGSLVRMAPEHRVAVITVANRSGASLGRTSERALELMLPLQPRAETASKPALPMTEAEMRQYAGVYSQGTQTVELWVKDGKLVGKRGRGSEAPVTKVGDLRFRMGGVQGTVFALVAGGNGKVAFLHSDLRTLKRVTN